MNRATIRWSLFLIWTLFTAAAAARAQGVELTVNLPPAAKVESARAVSGLAGQTPLESRGQITDGKIIFRKLLPATPYDVELELPGGQTVRGVDLGWYNEEPAKAGAGELSDGDRAAIADILKVPTFYNRNELLMLRGDHDRAVGLVQLIRDTDFHAAGGNVIWRVEVYYFKNQYGGWEKLQQQNKVIRRERFKSLTAFERATAKLRWLPELGGIRIPADAGKATIDVAPEMLNVSK